MPEHITDETKQTQSFWLINRIGDETRRPRHFNETLPFSAMVPYRLTRREVFSSDDVPLHYASSLEIVLYQNVTGEVLVDDKRVKIDSDCVVVVPPKIVHGGLVTGEAGVIFCLQISIEEMSHFINIENFLSDSGLSIEDAPQTVPECERIYELINDLFANNDNVFKRNIAILSIIEIIAGHIKPNADHAQRPTGDKEDLKKLITWTHNSYEQKISLEDAAEIVGFSKHYFCKWFKKRTGVNYINYLKRVRIHNASRLLLNGLSVSEVGYASGFESMSYFIKCFREIHGCTPKSYQNTVCSRREGAPLPGE